MNTEIPKEKLAVIQEALFEGRKIEAIKLYRKCLGTGLAEAKTAVDKLEVELRSQTPQKFAAKPASKGCLGIILAVCALAMVVVLLLVGR